MYECMLAYMYVYMYVCDHTYAYVCIYVCICMYVCMYVCMYARNYICTNVSTYEYVCTNYVHKHVCMYVCTLYLLIHAFQIPDCSTSLFVIAKEGLIFVHVLQSATSEISTQLKCDPH